MVNTVVCQEWHNAYAAALSLPGGLPSSLAPPLLLMLVGLKSVLLDSTTRDVSRQHLSMLNRLRPCQGAYGNARCMIGSVGSTTSAICAC